MLVVRILCDSVYNIEFLTVEFKDDLIQYAASFIAYLYL